MFKKFLSLLLCLIIVLSMVACGSPKDEPVDDTPPAIEDNIDNENNVTDENTEHEDLSNPDAPDYRDDTITENMGGITTCMIGETVELEKCAITLVGYETSKGTTLNSPKNDYFIGINFIIENTSEDVFSVGQLMDFTGYVDNFYIQDVYSGLFGNRIDVEIAPEKKVNGWIVYDINSNWEKFEVDFVYSDENSIEARFLIENEG